MKSNQIKKTILLLPAALALVYCVAKTTAGSSDTVKTPTSAPEEKALRYSDTESLQASSGQGQPPEASVYGEAEATQASPAPTVSAELKPSPSVSQSVAGSSGSGAVYTYSSTYTYSPRTQSSVTVTPTPTPTPSPTVTVSPTPTPSPSPSPSPTPGSTADAFRQYSALTPSEKAEFIKSFESVSAFQLWYSAALQAAQAEEDAARVSGDAIDLS